MASLQRAIENLEARLDASPARDELARVRSDLEEPGQRAPELRLPNLRLGFACKERWEDMVGDDRVRACGGCDRPVFDLSALTRDEGERLLATRGLTPCVRFYRRADGTVMTADCPTGERRERRRLSVVAGSVAALMAPAVARADPASGEAASTPETEATAPTPETEATTPTPVIIDQTFVMGIPLPPRFEMGAVVQHGIRPRPRIEWSIWSRLGVGFERQAPTVLARSLTPPTAESSTAWEAALAAEVTVGVARDGDLRVGAWAEVRTSSGPVIGGELVVGGLPPHPLASRIDGAGSLVLRAGGNAHVFTTAIAVGYVGARPRTDPWIRSINHVVGARIVASVNRSLDDPREWSTTFGLELEPIGAIHAVLDLNR